MIGYFITLLAYFLDDAIWIIGLNLQLGMAGIFNLGYIMFFGLGAYLASVFTLGPANNPLAQALNEHYILGTTLIFPFPWLITIVVCGILALFVGILIFRRIHGEYLAIVTFAIAQMCWNLVASNVSLFNGYQGLVEIPRPGASIVGSIGTQSTLLFLLLEFACFLLTLWFAQSLVRSPFGRTLRAVRENEDAAAALGKNVFLMRTTAFVCGACISALAGALLAEYITVWAPSSWTYTETFVAIAALIIGGRGNNWGAILGAFLVPLAFFEIVQYLPAIGNNAEVTAALQWVCIGILLLACLWFRPQGMLPEKPKRWKSRELHTALPDEGDTAPPSITKEAVSPPDTSEEDIFLSCQDVRHSFGGVQALDGASLQVRKGSITALIGPNGAGKSTLLNSIVGALTPQSGNIHFNGSDITRHSAYRTARHGLIRTFQKSSEFSRLTVLENMLVAAQNQPGERLASALFRRRSWKQAEKCQLKRAYELLKRCDLAPQANEYASALSGGQKRLLELARALMASPTMLVLDEPMTGISPVIVEQLIDLLLHLNAEGITLLIVEHDLSIVERLCNQVIVMAQGKVLAEGTLQEMRANEQVVHAYLS